jgi:formylglycine-generating enzyme required for sulfatase activity
MRNVGHWLAVAVMVGCDPSGPVATTPGVDASPGDLGGPSSEVGTDVAQPDTPDAIAATLDATTSNTLDATASDAPDVSTLHDAGTVPADAPDAPLALDATTRDAPDVAAPGDSVVVDTPAASPDPPLADVLALDASCAAGQAICDGRCVDLRGSSSHCGVCGRRCGGGETCVSSMCQPLPQRSCAGSARPGCGMVVLEGGRFTLGTPTQCFTNPDATCGQSASPPQTDVAVGRFAIDAYEVTVARFNAYASVRAQEMAAVRGAPIRYRGGAIAWDPAPNVEPTRQNRDYNWLPTSSLRDAHPVNGVDYWMAQEFCVWDGGRLPTEAEWEYVARGAARDGLAAGRVYPWGDDAPSTTCDRARWSYTTCPPGEDGARTMQVGRYPTGAAGGVFDLAGNVWEWVADNFTGYAGTALMGACDNRSGATDPLCLTGIERDSRVIRGGAWGDLQAANLRGASRGSYNPTLRWYNIGFRCARDLP